MFKATIIIEKLKNYYQKIKDYWLVFHSPLFDNEWYLKTYPDVAVSGMGSLKHFMLFGAAEGRNPGPYFVSQYYLTINNDVAEKKVNPLIHFLRYGWKENRNPCPYFEWNWYLETHFIKGKTNPLVKYVTSKDSYSLPPASYFETEAFLSKYLSPPKHHNILYYFVSSATDKEKKRLSHFINKVDDQRLKELHQMSYILPSEDNIRKQINRYISVQSRSKKKNKIAVYTVIIDHYDSLKLPEVLNPSIDYYCFTNHEVESFGVFKVLPVLEFQADSTRTARYIKTHPHFLLSKYEIVIWIDANVVVRNDLHTYISSFRGMKSSLALIKHPDRNSVAAEVKACQRLNKDQSEIMLEQLSHYKEEGFNDSVLIETNFFMAKIKESNVANFFNTWWREISHFSRRDQLSIPYALEKSGVSWSPIFSEGISVRSNPDFLILPHSHQLLPNESTSAAGDLSPLSTDPYLSRPSFYSQKKRLLKKYRSKSVDIVICIHNALDDVKDCLNSVVENLSRTQRLILINDGSNRETTQYLKSFCKEHAHSNNLVLCHNKKAMGYTKAVNKGIKLTTAEFIILLNSDTIVSKDWIEKLQHAADLRSSIGIVGPLSNAASYQSIPSNKGHAGQTAVNPLPANISITEMNEMCEKWTSVGILPITPLVHGFCFGIKRKVIDTIGLMDESSFPYGYGEENDYCIRASEAGFELVVATHTYIYHSKSKSYSPEKRLPLVQASSQKLKQLHGRALDLSALSMNHNPFFLKVREFTSATFTMNAVSSNLTSKPVKIGLILSGEGLNQSRWNHLRLLSPLKHEVNQETLIPTVVHQLSSQNFSEFDAVIVQGRVSNDRSLKELQQILLDEEIPLIVDLAQQTNPELLELASQIWLADSNQEETLSKLSTRKPVVVPTCLDPKLWRLLSTVSSQAKNLNKHLQILMMTQDSDQKKSCISAFERLPGRLRQQLTLVDISLPIADFSAPWYRSYSISDTLSYPDYVKKLLSHNVYHAGIVFSDTDQVIKDELKAMGCFQIDFSDNYAVFEAQLKQIVYPTTSFVSNFKKISNTYWNNNNLGEVALLQRQHLIELLKQKP